MNKYLFSATIVLFILLASCASNSQNQIPRLLEAQKQVEVFTTTLKGGRIQECMALGRIRPICIDEAKEMSIKNVDVVLENGYRDTYTSSEIEDMLNFYESEGGQKRAHNDLLYFQASLGFVDTYEVKQLTAEEERDFEEFKKTPGGKLVTERNATFQENVKKYMHLLEWE